MRMRMNLRSATKIEVHRLCSRFRESLAGMKITATYYALDSICTFIIVCA